MPFYEYECQSCKFYTEVMQKISDPPLVKCPSCGKRTMQKLMSAPEVGPNGTLGVLQISRKGTSAPSSGPDFTPADLQKLVAAAAAIAKCFK